MTPARFKIRSRLFQVGESNQQPGMNWFQHRGLCYGASQIHWRSIVINSSNSNSALIGGQPRPKRVLLAGVEIDNISFKGALDLIESLIRAPGPSLVVTPNVDHICQLQDDLRYREAYARADLAVADGMPLLWASRFLGHPLQEKISGSDLFPAMCDRASRRGYAIFLLGGLPGVAQKAKEVLEQRFPKIDIRGTYSPPFGFENDPGEISRIREMIISAAPHLLFVALGSPKQEYFIYDNMNILNVPVSIGVGASFDFVAGTVRRAPRFIQRLGLEWLFRLAQEPRRLFRRYLIRDTAFFRLILGQKLHGPKIRP